MQLGLNCFLKKALQTFLNDRLEAEPFMLQSKFLLEKSFPSLPGRPLLGQARVPLFLLNMALWLEKAGNMVSKKGEDVL